MAGLGLLALVVGALAATSLSLLPFLVVLVVTTIVGTGVALATAPHPSIALTAMGILFVAAQVGYGLGLGGLSLRGHRTGQLTERWRRDNPIRSLREQFRAEK